jgi:CRISPR-associated endonuclease/helicase Cas3
VPFDEKAKKAVEKLKVEGIPSGLIARELQTYTVQVPLKARGLLVHYGHVAFEAPTLRADQFAVLKTESLYIAEVGLLWETPEYLAVENMVL